MAATATDFENLFFCNFFSKFYEFQNPQDSGHNLVHKMTTPEATECQLPLQILKFEHFLFVFKTCEFQKTQDSGHAATQIACVPEAAKIQIPLRILKIEKNWTFKKKVQISENLIVRGRWLPNRLRPGGGQIPAGPEICEFFLHIFAPNLPSVGSSLPSLADSTTLARRIVRG